MDDNVPKYVSPPKYIDKPAEKLIGTGTVEFCGGHLIVRNLKKLSTGKLISFNVMWTFPGDTASWFESYGWRVTSAGMILSPAFKSGSGRGGRFVPTFFVHGEAGQAAFKSAVCAALYDAFADGGIDWPVVKPEDNMEQLGGRK